MEGLDLYNLLALLRRKWPLLVGPIVVFLVVGIVLCFVLPPVYHTEATLVPLKREITLLPEGLSSLLSGPRLRPAAKITAVLESRSLRERVIKRLDLLPRLFPKKWDQEKGTWRLKPGESPPDLLDGAQKLKNYLSVSVDKATGTILFEVEFPKDPALTQEIAWVALEEAQEILKEKAFSLAHLSRRTLERRLAEARRKIVRLEEIYRAFSEGRLKEVPLLLDEAEKGKPSPPVDEKVLREEMKRLKRLKAQVEAGLNGSQRMDFIPAPSYQFNLIKLKAQINALFELYSLLLREYELARIEDVRESLSFQVLDPPFLPKKERPYKPKKFLILGVALVGGAATGIFLVFLSAWLEAARRKD